LSLPKSVYRKLPKRMPESVGFSRYALDFDGVEDYVGVPDDPSLDLSTFTVSAWVKFSSDTGDPQYIAGKYQAGGNYPNYSIFADPGYPAFGTIFYNGSWIGSSGGSPMIGTWYHVAGTYDGSNLVLYVNGAQISSTSAAPPNTYDGQFQIGAREEGAANWTDGVIDHVCVCNRALSVDEIRRNMLNYHNPSRNGLVGWWRLEEGTGLTAHDESGNGNDGTLNPTDDPPTWIGQKKWEMRAEARL